MIAPAPKPSCLSCGFWYPEPWDKEPEQSDAYCIVEHRRTPADYRCETFERRIDLWGIDISSH
jgi:hypothetical protein